MISVIIKLCLKNEFAYKQSFVWWLVAVYLSNRFGECADPERVHKLLLAILRAGFTLEDVVAVARELEEGNDDAETREVNASLSEDSDGLLPKLDADRLKIAALAGSHTTFTFGAVAMGCTTLEAELQSLLALEGKLSLAKLRERSPPYADAVEQGVLYTVIRKDCLLYTSPSPRD